MIDRKEWRWFGCARHLCVSERCQFHLATEVGDRLISTVGEFFVNPGDKNPSPVSRDDLYETMTFRLGDSVCSCGCGQRQILPGEIDCQHYNTRGDAQRGHAAMCEKYAAGGG